MPVHPARPRPAAPPRAEGPARIARLAGIAAAALAALALAALACDQKGGRSAAPTAAPGHAGSAAPPTPADLPNGLVLALAQFQGGGGQPVPGAARLEFLVRRGGKWVVKSLEDPEAIVFHKAMVYRGLPGGPRLLTAAGAKPGEPATLKLWSRSGDGWKALTIWREDFGGKFSRMREMEVADLYGDGRQDIAVATHDQGVVAVVRPDGKGGFTVEKLDHQPDTFVHEIEIGDLDGDGVLEVYATLSEPNRLDAAVQAGEVTRYVPKKGEGRVVVAQIKDRHAKEILVGDVDGDGRDELYVSVEGSIDPATRKLTHGVDVLRYDAGTPPDQGVPIFSIEDRLSRFLTAGDVDGDGKKEMVIATYSQGLWLLRPGADPHKPWQKSLIDAHSGGFEHAALLTDLDGDGRDELYVASDQDKEVRRYVWVDGRPVREVIYHRDPSREIFTWNLMPLPADMVP